MMLTFLFLLCMTATSWGHRFHQAPEPSPSQSLATCPVVPGPTVPQLMDSDNSGVEKLVVHLYRNKNTQEIVAHVPYIVHQSCIPDFAQQTGRVFKDIGDNTIKNVFDNSDGDTVLVMPRPREKEIKENDEHLGDNQRPQRPSGLINIKNVPESYHNGMKYLGNLQNPTTQRTPSKDIEDTSESREYLENDNDMPDIPVPTVLAQIQHPNINLHESLEETAPDFQSYTGSTHRPLQYQSNTQVRPDSDSIPSVNVISKEPTSNSGVNINLHGLLAENTENDGAKKYPESLFSDKYEDYRPQDELGDREFNYQQYSHPHVHLFSQKDSIKHIQTEGDTQVPATITHRWQKIKVPVIDDKGNVNGWSLKIVKVPSQNLNPVKLNYWESKHKLNRWVHHRIPKSTSVYHQKLNKDIISFDYWLTAQLNNIKEIGAKVSLTSDDIFPVRQAIKAALKVNGFQMYYDGTLVDAEGNVSSLDNLLLQPIMVIKSIPHGGLYGGVADDSKEDLGILGSDLAPFQSLLVTLISPRKILGVIPLPMLPSTGLTQIKEHNELYRVLPPRLEVSYRQMSETEPALETVGYSADDEAPGFTTIGGSSAVDTGISLANRGRSGLEEADPISVEEN